MLSDKVPISIIVITFNEENNIQYCLESVSNFTEEIFIVDSFSTDNTLKIAKKYTDKIFQNPWTNYARQRQWALGELPLSNDWIFFLDADERFTEGLKVEINELLSREIKYPSMGGYYVSRKYIFLSKVIRWGAGRSGMKELRLFNRNFLEIGERAGHEVYICRRPVGLLREYIIHEDKKVLSAWINRHNLYSTSQANYLYEIWKGELKCHEKLEFGRHDKKLFLKEYFRKNFWNNLPTGFRPAILFAYYYFIRLGFLDGFPGLVYHFLHELWFPLLVDAKLFELKVKNL